MKIHNQGDHLEMQCSVRCDSATEPAMAIKGTRAWAARCGSNLGRGVLEWQGQPFWNPGLVSWKTTFPQTRGGGWFQDDSCKERAP